MKRTILKTMLQALAAVALVSLAAGCGKPTIQGATASYKTAKDNLDVLVAKQPFQMKIEIKKKIAEFEIDFKTAEAKGGEAAITAINALTRRMNQYRSKVDPMAGKKAATNRGTKLNNKVGTTNTVRPSKMGGGAAGGKMAPRPATGIRPAVRPTTAVRPAVRPATTKTGGSGFGGKTAPAVAPRPATKPAAGGSGFGGK